MPNPTYDPYLEENTGPQVQPAAVAAFLNDPTQDAPLPTTEVKLAGLSAKAVADLGGAAAEQEAAPAETTTIPANTTFEPGTPTDDKARRWAVNLPGMEDIKVEEAQKVTYLKATLLDEPVEWTIICAGMPIHVRSLSAYEQDVLFGALRKDEAAGDVTSPTAYGTWLQRYCARLQVLQMADRHIEPVVLPDKFEDAVALLRETTQAWVRKLSAPAFELMMAAVRVFEAKMTVCAQNLHNESFWTPAS